MFLRKLDFLFFNRRVWPRIAWDEQARAILKALLSQVVTACPVVTASRCEVATYVATFVSGVKSVQWVASQLAGIPVLCV